MKIWFKHYNNAHTKRALIELEEKFGFHKGYSMYFRLIEYCHATWDGAEDYIFTVSKNILATFLGCKSNVLRTFLERLQNLEQIKLIQFGNIIRISFPKLLEIQDRDSKYTRNKRVKGAQKTTLDKEEDKEEDKNKQKEKVSVKEFEKLWTIYPKKDGKKAALRHFKSSVKNKEDIGKIKIALDNYLSCSQVKKGYIKNGSTWFNNWEDWIDYKEVSHERNKRNNGKIKEKDYSAGTPTGFFD